MELFANDVSTTLSASANTSTTTMTIASASGFPAVAAPNVMRLRVEPAVANGTYEIVKVTARSGTTLTVTRAQEGTTGLSHASGAKVSAVLTAEQIAGFLSALVQRYHDGTNIPFVTDFLGGSLDSEDANTVEHRIAGVGYAGNNEWGAFRTWRLPPYNDAAYRCIIDASDGTPPANQPAFHLNDRRSGAVHVTSWGRTWTGKLLRNGVSMADAYVTTSADPTADANWAALPTGTIVAVQA